MPRLKKRHGVWHYDIQIAGHRERRSTRTSDRALAEDIAAKREWEIRRSAVYGQEIVTTFGGAVNEYLKAGKSDRFLLPLTRRWKDTPIKDITPGLIRQAARDLYPGRSPATWNRQVITPATAVVNHAADLELCKHIRVKRFKTTKPARQSVTRDWLDRFISASEPKLGALALFMFTTGARIGDATRLEWDTVDLQGGIAVLPKTKNGEAHTVHLTPDVVAMMANLETGRKVFGYAGRFSVYKAWKRACERAGLEYVPPHQAGRHSFATEMIVRAGVDVATTAELGGWKSHQLLSQTYVHPENNREKIMGVFGKKRTRGGGK